MLEIQCHGGISIINKILLELSLFENCRFAVQVNSQEGHLQIKMICLTVRAY